MRISTPSVVLSILLLLSFCFETRSETEVKWTPNPDSDAPLPLSNNQREQLLQLEQAIVTAPDPQATLIKAAEANGMEPNELANLLNKNRQELEAAGALAPQSGGGAGMRKNPIAVVFSIVRRSALANPKAFTVALVTLMIFLYLSWEAPRTGIILSSQASLLSKGRTTILNPPNSFVQQLLGSPKITEKPLGTKAKHAWKALNSVTVDDGVTWHKAKSIKKGDTKYHQALTSQTSVDTEFALGLVDEDEKDDVMDMFIESAVTLLSNRRFTDLAPSSVKFLPSLQDDRYGMLVVNKMGDYGRFGLLPVKVIAEHSDDAVISVAMATLKGAHWDGQIHIEVRKLHDSLTVRCSIVVPKPGRKVNRKIGTAIVSSMSESIAASIQTNVKLQIARRSQSSRFQGSARERAETRRRTRHEKETAIEEMSAERRRRWQRQNPNSGHYRPSGDRMKSPNNAVY